MELKTEKEIEYMRENALIVSRTLAEVAKNIKPGLPPGCWIRSQKIT